MTSDVHNETPFAIVRELLDELVYTAAVRDLPSHAACVSRSLRVLGVPGVPELDYEGWFARRRNELLRPLLFSLGFRGLIIKTAGPDHIACSVREIMKSMTGRVMELDKDMLVRLEADGHWRVVMEQIWHVSFRD